MVSVLVFGLLLACGVWNGISASPLVRIVGGSNANEGQYPHQVSLREKEFHFCGGSIINSRWILCAAHCIGPTILSSVVVVGTNKLNSGGLGYRLQQSIPHSGFDPNMLVNDISLLQVNTDIAYSWNVQPIQLADLDPPAHAPLQLSGWGLTSTSPQHIPNELQHITLHNLPVIECSRYLPNIHKSNICTYSPAGMGACNGDSGGPLIYYNVQVGVVSWGIPCAKGIPDVFTSVAAFRSWIGVRTGI